MQEKCGAKCEVYSRVCGYFRPVANWNKVAMVKVMK